jgi:hypothetical protein
VRTQQQFPRAGNTSSETYRNTTATIQVDTNAQAKHGYSLPPSATLRNVAIRRQLGAHLLNTATAASTPSAKTHSQNPIRIFTEHGEISTASLTARTVPQHVQSDLHAIHTNANFPQILPNTLTTHCRNRVLDVISAIRRKCKTQECRRGCVDVKSW